ncbi:MAG TPA: hypothetical protein VGU20_02865 [Stellaceae bacterium]|nr:hypothetical protein [Stellaceae bacterium]
MIRKIDNAAPPAPTATSRAALLSLDAVDDDHLIARSDFPLYGLPEYSKPHQMRLCKRGDFPMPVDVSARKFYWRAADLKRWRATRRARSNYAPERARETAS